MNEPFKGRNLNSIKLNNSGFFFFRLNFDDVTRGPAGKELVEVVDRQTFGRSLKSDLGKVGLLVAVDSLLSQTSKFSLVKLQNDYLLILTQLVNLYKCYLQFNGSVLFREN